MKASSHPSLAAESHLPHRRPMKDKVDKAVQRVIAAMSCPRRESSGLVILWMNNGNCDNHESKDRESRLAMKYIVKTSCTSVPQRSVNEDAPGTMQRLDGGMHGCIFCIRPMCHFTMGLHSGNILVRPTSSQRCVGHTGVPKETWRHPLD